MLHCEIFFSSFDGRLVSLPQVLCKLSVALHSIIHTIVKHVPPLCGVDMEMTSTLLLCIWRFKLVMFDIKTWFEHLWKVIFLLGIFPVYCYSACCTAQCFLVRFFFCFDGRLVSLPYILCKLSVALHSFFHTIVKHVSLLLGVDVEMTCSLVSLLPAFFACDAWE